MITQHLRGTKRHTLAVALDEYRRKRDFSQTPEPSGEEATRQGGPSTWDQLPQGQRYCVQMHRATRMHFDFRLEHDGVLLSWAVPRGPSLDPAMRRLAVQTEDHPVDYGNFEGVIPSGYGAGTVMLWDIGTFEWTRESAEDFARSLAKGDIKFVLHGSKLAGEFALVNIGDRGKRYGGSPDSARNWLMIKKRDAAAVSGYEAGAHDYSVKTARSLAQIAADSGGDPREAKRRQKIQTPASAATPTPTSGPNLVVPAPMLCRTADTAFNRQGWFFELKYDGVRIIAVVDRGNVKLYGRHGRDETMRYPEAARFPAAIRAQAAILDGEIVALDPDGVPSFERLQRRINVGRAADVRRVAEEVPITFAVFDLLHLDGRDLKNTELRIRKKTLRETIIDSATVMYADHVENKGKVFFETLAQRGIEGMVAKNATSIYHPGERTADWLKIKNWQTQSCVIAGYTAGKGGRQQSIGALILAIAQNQAYVHCGHAGTGFDQETLSRLKKRLDAIRIKKCPLVPEPAIPQLQTWVKPELVCEVRHAGWTNAGLLRHPVFIGLRPEITPQECTREKIESTAALLPPAAAEAHRGSAVQGGLEPAIQELYAMKNSGRWQIAGREVSLTNLEKVMWPEEGITKRDLIAYYVRVSPFILPYLKDRPLSTQIFPDGIAGKHFWRKDKPAHAPKWIESWTYHGEEKTKEYVVANETATLAWLANAAAIDLHPWHSRIDAPEQPDWAVFDLDPFEPATFDDVRDIGFMVKAALDHYHLVGALKTSGQTGLQIYVPIVHGPNYQQVRTWVEEVGRAIAQTDPKKRITWEWTVRKRSGQIRIDYTQNIINKTLTAPYTVRPILRAPVSVPITWDELSDPAMRPDRWTMADVFERLQDVGDLFRPVLEIKQELPH